MVNPFKPGDKVLILRQGVELEATVRTTWNHEVQVRIADGELLWRTVKTARLLVTAPTIEEKPIVEPAQPVEEGLEAGEPGPVLAEEENQPEQPVEAPEASLENTSAQEEPAQPEIPVAEVPAVTVHEERQETKPSGSKKARKRERQQRRGAKKNSTHPF